MTTAQPPLKFLGAPGSPYTRKMRSLLRYRHVPYRMIIRRSREDQGLPQPKVQLMPTFFLPDEHGEEVAVVDSTPLIRRFEAEIEGRYVIPRDPVIDFLDRLLEDYADEWLTKAMFHYRWWYPADIDKASEILPRWSNVGLAGEDLAKAKKRVSERQISRLWVVGSNQTTKPVIEDSYRRFLRLFSSHLETQPFLMGGRPGASDFAVYGQLTQLVGFDPTPAAVAVEEAPSVLAWTEWLEDLSGLEPTEEDWLTRTTVPPTLRALLSEVGRVYAPFLLGNASALESGAEQVDCEIDGKQWTQKPFPYQGKCLMWLRAAYQSLSGEERASADKLLKGTGCEVLFAGRAA